jgi:hypothetical protein
LTKADFCSMIRIFFHRKAVVYSQKQLESFAREVENNAILGNRVLKIVQKLYSEGILIEIFFDVPSAFQDSLDYSTKRVIIFVSGDKGESNA